MEVRELNRLTGGGCTVYPQYTTERVLKKQEKSLNIFCLPCCAVLADEIRELNRPTGDVKKYFGKFFKLLDRVSFGW